MNPQIRVFDLERIFIGQLPWTYTFEIVFRTTFMYAYTLAIIRLVGKRGLRELTLFEYVIIFALGSAVGDPMFYPEIPLLHGMAVVTTFVACHRALVLMTTKSPVLHRFVYPGETACLVRDGVLDPLAMRSERLNRKDIFMILREAGIENLGQVRRAYLEPTGEISVWRYQESEARVGLQLAPECDADHVEGRSTAAAVTGRYSCTQCGRTLRFESGEIPTPCTCRATSWILVQAQSESESGAPPAPK